MNLELIRKSISATNSQITKEVPIDPTNLAKQIWQDVWSVTGATPERCLYTFVELFIFKYLSDLNILNEDDKGNKINFKDIFALHEEKAFKNYSQNVRPYLKIMFPESIDDGTTIINGTVLNPKVSEHSKIFYKLLKKFKDFGEMKHIDPSFKSKVFEEFMKETISKKNWGQFFTPRTIIGAMIEISDIEKLEDGSCICDPACGVGGFILEPMKVMENGVNFYYKVEGNKILNRYRFHGFDKGFEKEEQLTIILAKANMLIFLSELIKKNPNLSQEFSNLFNSTFKLLSNTILGTLSNIESDKYDLILTNPPYVTSGSANYKQVIKGDNRLNDFYKINATGVEGLFLEWIIRSLKPSKKAFVVIPDGILTRPNDGRLRTFIRDECIINGIISLPINAFYRNPKKTYILAISKKVEKSEIERKEHKQTESVFTYLVSNVGETLDVNRFPIENNDLNEMVSLFNQFKGAKNSFKSQSKRCKIQLINKFELNSHWSVDRWWTRDEKVVLGIEEKDVGMTMNEFRDRMQETEKKMHELNEQLEVVSEEEIGTYSDVNLGNDKLFVISNGERITKKDIEKAKGNIPVYSASIFENEVLGYVSDNIRGVVPKARYFEGVNLTVNADGSDYSVFVRKNRFYANDVCNVITIIDLHIDPYYLKHELLTQILMMGLDYSYKLYKKKLKKINVRIPMDKEGNFDLQKQKEIAKKHERIYQIKNEVNQQLSELSKAVILV